MDLPVIQVMDVTQIVRPFTKGEVEVLIELHLSAVRAALAGRPRNVLGGLALGAQHLSASTQWYPMDTMWRGGYLVVSDGRTRFLAVPLHPQHSEPTFEARLHTSPFIPALPIATQDTYLGRVLGVIVNTLAPKIAHHQTKDGGSR